MDSLYLFPPDDNPQRQCTGPCKQWLPATNKFFSIDKNKRRGLNYCCKACVNKSQKEKRTPESIRDTFLRSKFGITLEQYTQMLEAQGGVCAVCKRPETRKLSRSTNGEVQPLGVDHCHKTGQIRALLCHACNSAFGLLQEDTNRIQELLEYAKWWEQQKSLNS